MSGINMIDNVLVPEISGTPQDINVITFLTVLKKWAKNALSRKEMELILGYRPKQFL